MDDFGSLAAALPGALENLPNDDEDDQPRLKRRPPVPMLRPALAGLAPQTGSEGRAKASGQAAVGEVSSAAPAPAAETAATQPVPARIFGPSEAVLPGKLAAAARPATAGRPALERYRAFEAGPMPERATPAPLKPWQSRLGTVGVIAADVLAPQLAPFIAAHATNAGRQRAADEDFERALDQRAATEKSLGNAAAIEGELAGAGTQEGAAPGVAKKIDEYTNAAGRRVEVLQAPDGSITEREGGQERPAERKTPLTLEQSYAGEVQAAAEARAAGDEAGAARHEQLAAYYASKAVAMKPPAADTGRMAPEIEAQIGPRPSMTQTPTVFGGKTYPSAAAADRAWGQRAEGIKNAEAAVQGGERAAAYQRNRMYPVLDTAAGNRPRLVSGAVLNGDTTGRYVPAAEGARATGREALIEDIRGGIENVRGDLGSMRSGFDAGTRAQLAAALSNPSSTAGDFFRGIPIGALDQAQQQYVIDLFSLREQAMAMRSVLGAGQGSEDLRRAIIQTLPGPATPSADFAQRQIDRFEQVLNRLERGVPTVPLPVTAPKKNPFR